MSTKWERGLNTYTHTENVTVGGGPFGKLWVVVGWLCLLCSAQHTVMFITLIISISNYTAHI